MLTQVPCPVTVVADLDVILLTYRHDIIQNSEGARKSCIFVEVQLELEPSTSDVCVFMRDETAFDYRAVSCKNSLHVFLGEVVWYVSDESRDISTLPRNLYFAEFEAVACDFAFLVH